MAKPRPVPDLSPHQPFAAAAARILAVRTQELAKHSHGVLGVDDIEPLHDMRVATRRLRAALEVFEKCFPKKLHRAALAEVKELADVLGERRDRDVGIASLRDFAERIGAADRRGVISLIAALEGEQLEANEALEPYVTEERVRRLQDRMRELIRRAEQAAGAPAGEAVDAAVLARESTGNGAGALA